MRIQNENEEQKKRNPEELDPNRNRPEQQEDVPSINSLIFNRFLRGIILTGVTYGVYALSMLPGFSFLFSFYQTVNAVLAAIPAYFAVTSFYDGIALSIQSRRIRSALESFRNANKGENQNHQINLNERELRYLCWLAVTHRDTKEGSELYKLLTQYLNTRTQNNQQHGQNETQPQHEQEQENELQDQNQGQQQQRNRATVDAYAEQRGRIVSVLRIVQVGLGILGAFIVGYLTWMKLDGIRKKLEHAIQYHDAMQKLSEHVKSQTVDSLKGKSIAKIAEEASMSAQDLEILKAHHGNIDVKLGETGAQRLLNNVNNGVYDKNVINVINAAYSNKGIIGSDNTELRNAFDALRNNNNVVYAENATRNASSRFVGAAALGVVGTIASSERLGIFRRITERNRRDRGQNNQNNQQNANANKQKA
ncbi:MAG: hypothetical protein QXF76_00220 [Candidatus Anstonellales archaeon]